VPDVDEVREPERDPAGAPGWWDRRAARHLAVGAGFVALAVTMLVFALVHGSALRSALVAVWAVLGAAFLVDAHRHRAGERPPGADA
jgi:peptidoglycan/LPS O-acetylase OafA/YrhL